MIRSLRNTLFNLLLLTILFSLLPHPIQTSQEMLLSTHSNLGRIAELQQKQNFHLHDPNYIRDSDADIKEYQNCIKMEQEKQGRGNILGPFYRIGVEGVNLTLECSPCIPKGRMLSWSKLTFESFQMEVKRTDWEDPNLTLRSPETDLSTYFCSWITNSSRKEIIMNIHTVEIIHINILQRVKAKTWIPPPPKESLEDNVFLAMGWGEWLECSKCNRVGRRHRIGFCSLQNLNPSIAPAYEALSIYTLGLSCSLFLNLHPDITDYNPGLGHLLGPPPLLMIGYCKQPCAPGERVERREFLSLPPPLRDLYLGQNVTPIAPGGFFKVIHFVKGFHEIPLTTQFIPEILALTLLILLQFCIIWQICKYKRNAR